MGMQGYLLLQQRAITLVEGLRQRLVAPDFCRVIAAANATSPGSAC